MGWTKIFSLTNVFVFFWLSYFAGIQIEKKKKNHWYQNYVKISSLLLSTLCRSTVSTKSMLIFMGVTKAVRQM